MTYFTRTICPPGQNHRANERDTVLGHCCCSHKFADCACAHSRNGSFVTAVSLLECQGWLAVNIWTRPSERLNLRLRVARSPVVQRTLTLPGLLHTAWYSCRNLSWGSFVCVGARAAQGPALLSCRSAAHLSQGS